MNKMADLGENNLSNKGNEFIKLFDDYRKENVKINNWVRRFTGIFEEINKLEKSLAKKDVLGKKSEDVDSEIYESLSRDLEAMKKFAVEVLEQIEKEAPVISEFLGRVSHDEIHTAKFSFDTIKSYNQEKSQVVYNLMSMMPSLAKDLKGVVEVPMRTMKDSAKYFIEFYKKLVMVIKSPNRSRGAMFESLGILLRYLVKYAGDPVTLNMVDRERFVGFVGKNTFAGKFADKYIVLGSANSLADKFEKLLSSNKIELSSTNPDGSTYNSLDKKKQEKIDKVVDEMLKGLFSDDNVILEIINELYEIKDDLSGGGDEDFDADKQLAIIRTRFYSLLLLFRTDISGVNGLMDSSLDAKLIEKSKLEFRDFFISLIGDKKENIVEENGTYSCKNFIKIINILSSLADDKKMSDFLKFVYENYENFSAGNYDVNLFTSFFKGLGSFVSLQGFIK